MAAAKATKVRVYVVRPRKREKCWQLRVKGPGVDRRRSSGQADKPAAEREARRLEMEINAGLPGASADPTIAGLFAMRLVELEADREVSPNTVNAYRSGLLAFSDTGLAGVQARCVTKADLIRAQTELQGAGRKPSTVRLYMAQAAAVWRWAQDLEILPEGLSWPRLSPQRRLKGTGTDKRPYSDQEVEAILRWVHGYRGGCWLPEFQLLADTGARVGAVLGLHGRDVARGPEPTVTYRVQWVGGVAGGWRPLKTREVLTVPIPSSTADLLPEPNAHDLLFPNARDPRRPARIEAVRDVLRKALAGIGAKDTERLDTHSLRRAWIRTAKRSGVADAVGMQVTGHRERAVYDGYDRNSRGDDLRPAVEAVHQARRLAGEGTCLPRESPNESHKLLSGRALQADYDLTS